MHNRCLIRLISAQYKSSRCLTMPQSITINASTLPRINANRKYSSSYSGPADMKMQGWQIHGYGSVDELQFSENIKVPAIRNSNECLVKVHTTTVNPIDVVMLNGYGADLFNLLRCNPDDIEFPLTLGREFCGELIALGMNTNSKLSVGERVWGVVPLHMNGSHAEYISVPDYCLSHAPTDLTNAEAASVLYAGLTAWSGLYITGGLGGLCGTMTSNGGGAGKRVLVLGGAGSVGSLAIQMLKAEEVQVFATCSEDAMQLVRNSGADYVLDYRNNIEMAVLNNYGPFDIILDCAGQGALHAEELKLNFHQYITFSSPMIKNFDNSGLAMGAIRNVANLVESNFMSLTKQGAMVKWGFFAPAPQGIEFIQKLVERKRLLPNIDSSFKFDEMSEAFEKVKNGHLRGKVVVHLSDD